MTNMRYLTEIVVYLLSVRVVCFCSNFLVRFNVKIVKLSVVDKWFPEGRNVK